MDPSGEFAITTALLIGALVGVLAAEGKVIHEEVTEGKELFTLDPSKGVSGGEALKFGGVVGASTTAAILTGGASLEVTGFLGIGGTAVGTAGATTGSAVISSVLGGAAGGYTGGFLGGISEGRSLAEAHEQAKIGMFGGAVAGLGGYGAGALTTSLLGRSAVATAISSFAGGAGGDYALQQTFVGFGLQERVNWRRVGLSGAAALGASYAARGGLRRAPAVSRPETLQLQRELSIKANRTGAALQRWLRTPRARVHPRYGRAVRTYQDIMNNPNATPRQVNFAKLIRGRFLDRRMKNWMEDTYRSRYPNMRLDKAVPNSGSDLRPDVYLPDIGGRRVIYDFGGASKIEGILDYQGLADDLIPIVPESFVP